MIGQSFIQRLPFSIQAIIINSRSSSGSFIGFNSCNGADNRSSTCCIAYSHLSQTHNVTGEFVMYFRESFHSGCQVRDLRPMGSSYLTGWHFVHTGTCEVIGLYATTMGIL